MAGGGNSCSGYEHVQAKTSLMMLKRAVGAAPALPPGPGHRLPQLPSP